LAELKFTTRQRAEDENDIKAQIEIYARKLEEYPFDVVLNVLTQYPNESQWFPSWFELRERLEGKMRKRREYHKMLDAMKTQREKPAPENKITREQLDKLMAPLKARWANENPH
jgi:hypothetical protein